MLVIPTQAVANQTFTVILAAQATRISIRQTEWGMFMDVGVNDAPLVSGVICQDRNRIVREAYLGFIGDFAFIDTQGTEDPYYTGLGTRWVLAYLEAADL